MDGRQPGPSTWAVSTICRPKTTGKPYARMALGTGLPKRRVLAQSDAGHGQAGEHPVVTAAAHVASWSRLRWLVLPVGHAQQHLQLLGAAPGGQDLLGGLKPAQHEHGQGRGGRVVRVD
jgi:hypothetical protein